LLKTVSRQRLAAGWRERLVALRAHHVSLGPGACCSMT
jgi:hypothetical protein